MKSTLIVFCLLSSLAWAGPKANTAKTPPEDKKPVMEATEMTNDTEVSHIDEATAKATCAKEQPALKGNALAKCIKDKMAIH